MSRRPAARGEPPGKRARTKWESWRVVELRQECRTRGLSTQGRKNDLINRLCERGEDSASSGEESGEDSSLYLSLSPLSDSPPPSPPLDRLLVTELRQRCRDQGLPAQGRKDVLVQRLLQARAESEEEEESRDALTDGDSPLEEEPSAVACDHVTPDSVQRRGVEKIALNPVRWKCQTCGTTESVLVCLTCAHVGCGRHGGGHAQKHARTSGHALVINVNTAATFCHVCEGEVQEDTPARDLAQLRQCLRGLRTLNNHSEESGEDEKSDSLSVDMDSSVDGPLPRAKLRRRASQFIMRPLDHDIEDCYETSQAHYRNNVLARPFHAWKMLIDHRRRQHLARLLDGEEEEEEEEEVEGELKEERGERAEEEKEDRKSPSSSSLSLETSGVESTSPPGLEEEELTPSLSSQEESQGDSKPRAPLSWLSRTKTLQLSQSFSLDETPPCPSSSPSSSRFRPRRTDASSRTSPAPPAGPSASSRKSDRSAPSRTPRLPGLSRTSSSSVLIIPGQTGLRNLGNSCFMNAVIQALSSLAELRRFFTDTLLPRSGGPVPLGNKMITRVDTSDCLARIHDSKLIRTLQEKEISVCLELHSLMRVIWSGKNAVITPHSLFGAMWALKPTFQGYQQQDAEELLSFLMDKVDEELRESSARTRRASLRFPSIMEKLCQGVLRTTITCEHCGHVSHRQEPFRQLCWPIPEAYVTTGRPRRRATTPTPTCDLNDLFQAWQAPESLSGYRCEACGDTEHSHKNVTIAEAPDILCVVINRFAWSARGRAKINTLVTYPLAWEVPMPPRASVAYALRSVVRHHGFTLNSGHYTATVYNTVRDLWLDCNDHVIKPLEPHQVVPQDNTAYILFYAQHEGAWP